MDLSLDEIIQSKRKVNRPKQSQNVPVRRGRISKPSASPMQISRNWQNNNNNSNNGNRPWSHDMFHGNRNQMQPLNRSGAKIKISNLDFGVTNDDINELFKEFGTIVRAGVQYDRSGRSMGTAEVSYSNRSSAVQARNKYNGIPLDNKPMAITILDQQAPVNNGVGGRLTMPVQRSIPNTRATNGNGGFVRRQAAQSRPFNNGNSNRSKDAPKRNQKVAKTKEQLDQEMDAYLANTE